VHNVSRWPNLRHLGELLGGAEGKRETMSFKKATEKVWVEEVVNATRWGWVGAASLK